MSGSPVGRVLDEATRVLLSWFDTPTSALIGASAMLVFALVFKKKHQEWPGFEAFIGSFLGAIMILNGLTLAMVFWFTRPYAVDQISEGSAVTVGIMTLVGCGFTGFRGIRMLLKQPERGGSVREQPDSQQARATQEQR